MRDLIARCLPSTRANDATGVVAIEPGRKESILPLRTSEVPPKAGPGHRNADWIRFRSAATWKSPMTPFDQSGRPHASRRPYPAQVVIQTPQLWIVSSPVAGMVTSLLPWTAADQRW